METCGMKIEESDEIRNPTKIQKKNNKKYLTNHTNSDVPEILRGADFSVYTAGMFLICT